jgi:hypothetical protein
MANVFEGHCRRAACNVQAMSYVIIDLRGVPQA